MILHRIGKPVTKKTFEKDFDRIYDIKNLLKISMGYDKQELKFITENNKVVFYVEINQEK